MLMRISDCKVYRNTDVYRFTFARKKVERTVIIHEVVSLVRRLLRH